MPLFTLRPSWAGGRTPKKPVPKTEIDPPGSPKKVRWRIRVSGATYVLPGRRFGRVWAHKESPL